MSNAIDTIDKNYFIIPPTKVIQIFMLNRLLNR